MSHDLVSRLRIRDRGTLGRAVTVAENGGIEADRLLRKIGEQIDDSPDRCLIVGFTGSPGSGKSTLIDALIETLRKRGKTIAVIAIDPSSPFSGGAVLGDRCRMNRHQTDQGVYIRSLSARGNVGGVSDGARRVIAVLKASRFDVVLIETVGAGQSEIDVSELVDVCVVVCTPNSGDDIQAIKSGLLEVADILVANKTDLADAERTVQQLVLAQSLPSIRPRRAPVVSTVATEGKGIEELADHIAQLEEAPDCDPRNVDRSYAERRVARAIGTKIQERLLSGEDPLFEQICDSVRNGSLDMDQAATQWFEDK